MAGLIAMNQPTATAVTSYFDSSALVKRYLVETRTRLVERCVEELMKPGIQRLHHL